MIELSRGHPHTGSRCLHPHTVIKPRHSPPPRPPLAYHYPGEWCCAPTISHWKSPVAGLDGRPPSPPGSFGTPSGCTRPSTGACSYCRAYGADTRRHPGGGGLQSSGLGARRSLGRAAPRTAEVATVFSERCRTPGLASASAEPLAAEVVGTGAPPATPRGTERVGPTHQPDRRWGFRATCGRSSSRSRPDRGAAMHERGGGGVTGSSATSPGALSLSSTALHSQAVNRWSRPPPRAPVMRIRRSTSATTPEEKFEAIRPLLRTLPVWVARIRPEPIASMIVCSRATTLRLRAAEMERVRHELPGQRPALLRLAVWDACRAGCRFPNYLG